MTKQELKLLEKAFSASVDSSMRNGMGIIQTKSKIASKLAADGLLEEAELTLNYCVPPVKVKGYAITMLGHYTYCANCGSDEI